MKTTPARNAGGSVVPREKHQSYDPSYFARHAEIIDRHFWYRSRNRLIRTLTGEAIHAAGHRFRGLEVGCGTGVVLKALKTLSTSSVFIGTDLHMEGLTIAAEHARVPLVQSDADQLPFGAVFDWVGMFDVLEHLPDDRAILRSLHGSLKSGGQLVISVPADMRLWSYFDEASSHCRRYEPGELQTKLVETGYRVVFDSYFMATLYPPLWIGRRTRQLLSKLGARRHAGANAASAQDLAIPELRPIPVVNELLDLVLRLEAALVAGKRRLPFGTSLLVVASKSAGEDAGDNKRAESHNGTEHSENRAEHGRNPHTL